MKSERPWLWLWNFINEIQYIFHKPLLHVSAVPLIVYKFLLKSFCRFQQKEIQPFICHSIELLPKKIIMITLEAKRKTVDEQQQKNKIRGFVSNFNHDNNVSKSYDNSYHNFSYFSLFCVSNDLLFFIYLCIDINEKIIFRSNYPLLN